MPLTGAARRASVGAMADDTSLYAGVDHAPAVAWGSQKDALGRALPRATLAEIEALFDEDVRELIRALTRDRAEDVQP